MPSRVTNAEDCQAGWISYGFSSETRHGESSSGITAQLQGVAIRALYSSYYKPTTRIPVTYRRATAALYPWKKRRFGPETVLVRIAGHAYYFLEDVYPRMTGRRPLKTPSIVKAMFPGEGDVISPAAFAMPQAVRPQGNAAPAAVPGQADAAAGGPPFVAGAVVFSTSPSPHCVQRICKQPP